MNLKKYFSLVILIVFIGLSVVLSTQVVNIYQTSQKRDAARAEYYQSQKKYRNADSNMSEKDKTELKIKLQDQRYTYKVLKYEKRAQVAWMKVVVIVMFSLVVISYRMKQE